MNFNSMAGYGSPGVYNIGGYANPKISGAWDIQDLTTPAVATAGGGSGGLWGDASNWLFGNKDTATGAVTNGAAGSILGIAQGLGNAYMGMQQFGLAKKALKQSKDQFDMNYAAQKKTTNATLEDRQRARVASNAGAYESVGSYMQKNGIA